jgi:hypothetical protein
MGKLNAFYLRQCEASRKNYVTVGLAQFPRWDIFTLLV